VTFRREEFRSGRSSSGNYERRATRLEEQREGKHGDRAGADDGVGLRLPDQNLVALDVRRSHPRRTSGGRRRESGWIAPRLRSSRPRSLTACKTRVRRFSDPQRRGPRSRGRCGRLTDPVGEDLRSRIHVVCGGLECGLSSVHGSIFPRVAVRLTLPCGQRPSNHSRRDSVDAHERDTINATGGSHRRSHRLTPPPRGLRRSGHYRPARRGTLTSLGRRPERDTDLSLIGRHVGVVVIDEPDGVRPRTCGFERKRSSGSQCLVQRSARFLR
jgi:hypothetical protein